MIKMYGLKNCDTCRKAIKWLNENDIDHTFIDIRADTPPKSEIAGWVRSAAPGTLVNKSSTTWRGLDDATKDGLSEANMPALLSAHPTLIKRPVFVSGDHVIVGFKDAQKDALAAL